MRLLEHPVRYLLRLVKVAELELAHPVLGVPPARLVLGVPRAVLLRAETHLVRGRGRGRVRVGVKTRGRLRQRRTTSRCDESASPELRGVQSTGAPRVRGRGRGRGRVGVRVGARVGIKVRVRARVRGRARARARVRVRARAHQSRSGAGDLGPCARHHPSWAGSATRPPP